MKNEFVAQSYINQQFCKAEYVDTKYVAVRPELTAYDILILKAFAFVTKMRADLTERKSVLVDDITDIGYLVQKEEDKLFLYSNKKKEKLYIDIDEVLTEFIKKFDIKGALEKLSEYLSEGMLTAKQEGSILYVLYAKTT